MKKEILVILDYRNYFRRELSPYLSLDLNKIKKVFIEADYKIEFINYSKLINDILNDKTIINNKIIIYTSSSIEEYKYYMEETLYLLNKNNILLPKIEAIKAQENKGFQEIYKKSIGLKSLKSYYFSTLEDFLYSKEIIKYPIIFKKIDGAGSCNVHKLDNEKNAINIIKKNCKRNGYYYYRMKEVMKIYFFKKKYIKNLELESKYIDRYLLQEFVPNLENDWKILVFGKKYYCLKRTVRKGDFRASGSGIISFECPPEEILNYAKECAKKLDFPIVSLDICMDINKQCFLIEYQALHFGPLTLINSVFYYELNKGKFELIRKKSDLSTEYGLAMLDYIEKGL